MAHPYLELVDRIDRALTAAENVFATLNGRKVTEMRKTGGDPLTHVDLALDEVLRDSLQVEGDGWLSEETADDLSRLDTELVWIVDPLDGTREFIDGLPEFCTSVAAVVDGMPVAGGVVNPAADLRVVGAIGLGVSCNGESASPRPSGPLAHMTVLASRSEVGRGQWEAVESAGIVVQPMGSVAYKMARVAAGLDHATWTPVPKHEWDVAGGAALMAAAGGSVIGVDGELLLFNQPRPWFSGVIAVPPGFEIHLEAVKTLIHQQRAG
ncbi:MAG TPA: inositol monophosphatase family protein [Acidimicrobiia bacterium]|nr:inositol monophosphatase family protein [Acidimicrobiia bacterium]